ncbi:ATP-binding protein [Pendulispora rubella]|uniref:histidine kinase n=1 Tax=Pendulispora rubella TaxID=2741070 RepID=A0ABZ2L7P8_9BACT
MSTSWKAARLLPTTATSAFASAACAYAIQTGAGALASALLIGVGCLAVALAASLAMYSWRKSHVEMKATQLGIALEAREKELAERERLLKTLVESVPMAIVLFTGLGQILYANEAARALFFDGAHPDGGNFLNRLGRAPEALRRAILGEGDELFSIYDENQQRQTYHLAKRHMELDGESVVLVVVNNLSRELYRQEVDLWKRLLRVLTHELNNSMAPIKSLVNSGRTLIRGVPEESRLTKVFDTVAGRAEHLESFVHRYAEFARLPAPRKAYVELAPFVERLGSLFPEVAVDGELSQATVQFDVGQIEQALINLLKNAIESSGSAHGVTLRVEPVLPSGLRFGVLDRGPGMSPEVLKHALVPFFSTKDNGTGLGLPIASEIVEAHGGVLRLQTREGGGLEVWIRLPGPEASSDPRGKLTLTRT